MLEQSQSVYVSVAHRYWNSQWPAEQNQEVYGRDASSEGVGSNLRLTVHASGASELNFDEHLVHLKSLCDHRCFFTDVDEFLNTPSTLERITVHLSQALFPRALAGGQWTGLTVAENERIECKAWPGANDLQLREKHLNLLCTVQGPVDSQTGLVLPRGELWRSLQEIAPEFAEPSALPRAAWGERLFAALKGKVKTLRELEIDLGGHDGLRIQSTT